MGLFLTIDHSPVSYTHLTHTFLLASHFPKADITAIDSHSPYIQTLNQRAAARGISDRVHGLEMSMFDMTFEKESFDLIWSEGAIYIIGFERGLDVYKRQTKGSAMMVNATTLR